MFNTTQDEQNQKMMEGLRNWYATRNDPKPPAPVSSDLGDFNRAMERHTARENAQRMEQLSEAFRIINSKRITKSK